MIARCARALSLLVLVCAGAHGQLPLVTIPSGALQIGISGSFYPNDHAWDNGNRVPLGTLIGANPLIGPLQSNLAGALGMPVSGLTLGGGVSPIAAREHGVGNISLAYGLTHRITIFTTAPIVYTRGRAAYVAAPGTARLGINPALVAGSGQQQSTLFFNQFDAAIATLSHNVQSGTYASNAPLEALAQQTLSSATAMRASYFTLLADPAHATLLLPTQQDGYGSTLLAQVAVLQNTLSTQLSINTFTVAPAFPTTALTPDDLTALIGDPAGFAYKSPNEMPSYGLGDVEAGVAVQLMQSDSAGSDHWHSAWLRATGRFSTGAAADPTILLDQGTGVPSPAFQIDGIGEIGRRRLGIRGEFSYQHQMPANSTERIAPLDQLLVSPADLASVRTQPGDSFSIAARPFIAFAPHFAFAALVQYWRTSASRTTYIAGQVPIAGVDPGELDIGSAANAVVVGFGLSYSYQGVKHDENGGLPVEASWSIERSISSTQGVFPAALTTRVSLRLYRPIVKH